MRMAKKIVPPKAKTVASMAKAMAIPDDPTCVLPLLLAVRSCGWWRLTEEDDRESRAEIVEADLMVRCAFVEWTS